MKLGLTLVILLGCVPAFAQPIFHKENIFPFQPKHVHSSSIVQCPNGDLLVCWFHGSGERTADDVVIQGSRLKKGQSRWAPVFLMADTRGFPDCNPVLFIDKKQRLHLFWISVLAHRWEMSILKYRISTNYQGQGAPEWAWQDNLLFKPGPEFAAAVEKGFREYGQESVWAEYAPAYEDMIIEAAKDPAKRQLGWMPRTHVTILSDGRYLLPLYSDGFCLGIAAISDDDGDSWRAGLPMVGPGLNQPSIVERADGTLVAYLRNEGIKPMRVLVCESTDRGESWSFARFSDIPNPSSSLEVIALADGKWVMVFNDTEEGRHSLAAALSDDEGITWKWKRHIELAPPNEKSFSYPSVIQTGDGLIHVTYSYAQGSDNTIRHAFFNEQWIKAGP